MAVLLLATVSTQILNVKSVFADDSTDYTWYQAPAINPPPPDTDSDYGYTLPCPSIAPNCTSFEYVKNGTTYGEGDTWGYGFRNCTSYLAWKMHQQFSADIHGWGHAKDWDNNAPSSEVHNASGYTPVVGDIAQWEAHTGDSDGHVAYVHYVESNGIADLWEYNHAYDGNFLSNRTTASGSDNTPDHYIHIGTVTTTSATTSRPAVLNRSSDSMDVFYRSTSHQLVEQGWNATNSWGGLKTAASSGVSSNPTADTRTSDSMDAFYRDTSNNLEVVGWSAAGDWTGPTAIITDGSVNADPVVIAPDSNHMWVFYKDSTGRLMDKKWDNVNGWASPHIDISSSSVASSPSAVVLDANNFFVFYHNTSGNLDEIGYSSGAWSGPSTRANNVASDFTAISRTSTSLDLFYKASGGGLGNVGYSSGSWSDYEWTVGNTIATSGNSFRGSPLVIKRDSNNMSVFYQDNQNNLVEKAWNGTTGWAAPYNRASNIYDNPGGTSRTSDSLDVFFRDGVNNLISQGWSAAGGWTQGATGAGGMD